VKSILKSNVKSFHLAGIIPVAGQKLDFNVPWHDALMPIAPNYLAVERCVVECAYAGCETIWIVCNDDIEPLIRHRIGDYAQDPIWLERVNKSEKERKIPIFYIPIHPHDRNKRDSLGWSVVHGALTASSVSGSISKWTRPDRFYVSFPYGVYPVEQLAPLRRDISSNKGFALSCGGRTIKDGAHLGFTFTFAESREIRKYVMREGTGVKKGNPMKKSSITLPVEERYSARHFSLDNIFKSVKIDIFSDVLFHYDIDSWEGYSRYLGSGDSLMISANPNIVSYREFNPIGEDSDA
tara:strand:- start:33255 stop:34139 length:885 start_codon:yes stop_codon:yes gene_type:complete